jgi:hypothetical protein
MRAQRRALWSESARHACDPLGRERTADVVMAVELPGSRAGHCSARTTVPPAATRVHEVVFHLRPRPDGGGLGWVNLAALLPPARRRVLTWTEYAARYGAASKDIAIVRGFAAASNLSITIEDPQRRRIAVRGTTQALERAFGIELHLHGDDATAHLSHDGALWVPPAVRAVTQSVLGVDGCTRLRWSPPTAMPSAGDNAGERADASVARSLLGVPAGVEGLDCHVAVAHLGAVAEQDPDLRDLVSAIDDIAPKARVTLHQGNPAVADMVDAVLDALTVEPPPSVLVLGWGAPEAEWSGAAIRTLEHIFFSAAAMGIAVVAACPGDGQPWFPASSPHVVACSAADRRQANSQPAISTVFPATSWQEMSLNPGPVAGRTTPDLVAPLVAQAGRSAVDGSAQLVAAGRIAGVIAAVAAATTTSRPGLVTPMLARSTSLRGGTSPTVASPPLFDSLMIAMTGAAHGGR